MVSPTGQPWDALTGQPVSACGPRMLDPARACACKRLGLQQPDAVPQKLEGPCTLTGCAGGQRGEGSERLGRKQAGLGNGKFQKHGWLQIRPDFMSTPRDPGAGSDPLRWEAAPRRAAKTVPLVTGRESVARWLRSL